MIVFFKTGILSWTGILALWIPFVALVIWVTATSWTVDRAIVRQACTRQLSAVSDASVS
jgi:predicted nucleic acid-binding protein